MLVLSCHSDTGFGVHALDIVDSGRYYGHLDNFACVYGVMKAYFSGRINNNHTRIELTHGEETNMEGAREVLRTLHKNDFVIVIDVTATNTSKDIVVEKCKNPDIRKFIKRSLSGLDFDMYRDCPDPISQSDEVDIYSQECARVCFLGLPCFGGDYNNEKVFCRKQSIDNLAEAICRLSEAFPSFCREHGIPVI